MNKLDELYSAIQIITQIGLLECTSINAYGSFVFTCAICVCPVLHFLMDDMDQKQRYIEPFKVFFLFVFFLR